jgi:hypothetical protein
MNRQEAIQRIIWSLLAHANAPHEAVAAALTVKPHLGHRAEADFRNLLRAAGLFAFDEDGFFMRYVRRLPAQEGDDIPSLPSPTHLLTVPVPVEPRMRIAYSVFTGLLLKHLYQCHAAVPLQVTEGMALLWVPEQAAAPASALPDNAKRVWQEFQSSQLAEDALQDGIEATLSAMGRAIGAIGATDSLARGALFRVLLEILPRHERDFQTQGGMRLDFYSRDDILEWRRVLAVTADSAQTVESLWAQGLNGSDSKRAASEIAGLMVTEALAAASPMPFRYVRGLWRGEGSGKTRKPGKRDVVHWPQAGDENASRKAEDIDKAVEEALSKLERARSGTRDVDRWVARTFAGDGEHRALISCLASLLVVKLPAGPRRSTPSLSLTSLVDDMSNSLPKEALVAFLKKEEKKALGEIKAAVSETCKNVVAWHLARKTDRDDIAIFGWPVTILRNMREEERFALRFISKIDPPGARAILRVLPLGDITAVNAQDAVSPVPFSLTGLGGSPASSTGTTLTVASGSRCVVCGSRSDLLKGAASFLPESKKRWYESPTSFVEPKLCSNCAFVAYLSAIYPNSDSSVVEFPSDNFLELFALHEHLQGVSGAVALKTLNRVGALSILPSRYLLLSKNSRQGRMDSKTQIYVQLRHHTPLLQNLDRPMRVQVEGSQPNFWSEVYPHVAIGLSHFARMPSYYESKDRKVVAQRVVRAFTEGRPFAAAYLATQAQQPDRGFGRERSVFSRGLRAFEDEFIRARQYGDLLAQALGGARMSYELFGDVIDFSNYLLTLCQPLVKREVRRSGSSVSGIARKFTDLIAADFGQCRVANFLYVTCQKADKADSYWAKRDVFAALYPAAKDDSQIKAAQQALDSARSASEEAEKALKQAADADREQKEAALQEVTARKTKAISAVREAWDAFRMKTPRTELESRLAALHQEHGGDAVVWRKFLREVEARTLALLLLNVHQA